MDIYFIFVIFCVSCCIGFAFIYFTVLETKGLNKGDIDKMYCKVNKDSLIDIDVNEVKSSAHKSNSVFDWTNLL